MGLPLLMRFSQNAMMLLGSRCGVCSGPTFIRGLSMPRGKAYTMETCMAKMYSSGRSTLRYLILAQVLSLARANPLNVMPVWLMSLLYACCRNLLNTSHRSTCANFLNRDLLRFL